MSTHVASRHAAHGAGRGTSALVLLAHLVAVAVVAGLGGLAASSATDTYAALELPPYAPPSWLFGPAWTVLYVLMAVAAWRTWRVAGLDRAQVAYGVQLLLNLAWTPLFFSADRYAVALAEILVLWCALAVTLVLCWRRDRVAGWLLVPYLAWVTFATALNAGIVVLN
ncbi:tryptophan-rich sensory protein [Nocardioides sp. GY 10113]|uniref:TspO/MBR family protein n=1 Tax=Nocardioides sp. GY 10113 TaxID=2569761 RepID=UPI0010A8AADA|nr:TspO/MBR family protein [Nocardioides sp. GY 10113]TIC85124.1 tryptophan-rich sensory protein [Nocardioides sp. GY 10113]